MLNLISTRIAPMRFRNFSGAPITGREPESWRRIRLGGIVRMVIGLCKRTRYQNLPRQRQLGKGRALGKAGGGAPAGSWSSGRQKSDLVAVQCCRFFCHPPSRHTQNKGECLALDRGILPAGIHGTMCTFYHILIFHTFRLAMNSSFYF